MDRTRWVSRQLAVVLSAAFLVAAGGPDEPDWRGTLSERGRQLDVAAYFDEERTRGFVVVGQPGGGFTSKVYRAWSVRVGDLDADGTDEVILGIWSDAPRHDEPQPHRTVWVLKWDGERLAEAWRGSALSRPLHDFELSTKEDGVALLVANERVDHRCFVTTYRWNGFGFTAVSTRRLECPSERTGER